MFGTINEWNEQMVWPLHSNTESIDRLTLKCHAPYVSLYLSIGISLKNPVMVGLPANATIAGRNGKSLQSGRTHSILSDIWKTRIVSTACALIVISHCTVQHIYLNCKETGWQPVKKPTWTEQTPALKFLIDQILVGD